MIMIKRALGTCQSRLNTATDYAKAINQTTTQLELMWQLHNSGTVPTEQASNYIKACIDELDEYLESFKHYYSWREDMEGK